MQKVSENITLQWHVIYIAEAHAIDEWPISSSRYNFGEEVHVPQHRTIKEREKQAIDFFKRFNYLEEEENNDHNNSKNSARFPWTLFASTIPNDNEVATPCFESIYKPWPFRIYGFVDGVIDFIAEPHACEVRIEEVTFWLSNYLDSST